MVKTHWKWTLFIRINYLQFSFQKETNGFEFLLGDMTLEDMIKLVQIGSIMKNDEVKC